MAMPVRNWIQHTKQIKPPPDGVDEHYCAGMVLLKARLCLAELIYIHTKQFYEKNIFEKPRKKRPYINFIASQLKTRKQKSWVS